MKDNIFIFILFSFATLVSGGIWNFTEIDEYIESVRQCRGRPAVTIAIVELDENDEIKQKYANAYGRVDPTCTSNCDQPTNETRFCIGSLTKQFTSGVVGATLKQSKNFAQTNWDTTLISILGDEGKFFGGKSPAEFVTLRDILAHRMGIPKYDGGWLFGLTKPHEEIWSNIHNLNAFDPTQVWRSSFLYNNWMYTLAGYVSEKISGSTWEDLIKKHFFTPLGMQESQFIHMTDFDNYARVGLRLSNETWISAPLCQIGNITSSGAPAGSICTSSNDFLKYLKFLLTQNSTKLAADQQILLNAIHEAWEPSNYLPYVEQGSSLLMFKPRYKIDNTETTYGFGWFQGVWRDYRYITHDGDIQGYLSTINIFPDARVGVFVSTTNSIDEPMDYTHLFSDWLTDYVLGYEPWLTNQSACTEYPEKWYSDVPSRPQINFDFLCDITESDAQPYVGTYEHPMFGTATVKFANGTMRWTYGYFGHGLLCKTNPNTGLKSDDFRMMFDNDPFYNVLNDPSNNVNSGAVFMFDPKGASVNLAVIDSSLPPNFVRSGIVIPTSGSDNTATSTPSTTKKGDASTTTTTIASTNTTTTKNGDITEITTTIASTTTPNGAAKIYYSASSMILVVVITFRK